MECHCHWDIWYPDNIFETFLQGPQWHVFYIGLYISTVYIGLSLFKIFYWIYWGDGLSLYLVLAGFWRWKYEAEVKCSGVGMNCLDLNTAIALKWLRQIPCGLFILFYKIGLMLWHTYQKSVERIKFYICKLFTTIPIW